MMNFIIAFLMSGGWVLVFDKYCLRQIPIGRGRNGESLREIVSGMSLYRLARFILLFVPFLAAIGSFYRENPAILLIALSSIVTLSILYVILFQVALSRASD